MKRLLWMPVLAAVVWGQENPSSNTAANAEKALRERVLQFYQLQVDKKYRQSEAYVAEDTVDQYLSSGKGNLLGFSIEKVELSNENTRAKVTLKVKATMTMMGSGRLPIETIAVTSWRIENGQWVWYMDPAITDQGPFGAWRPVTGGNTAGGPPDLAAMRQKVDIAALQDQVKIDRSSVILSAAEPMQNVVISNALPGSVALAFSAKIPGVSVQIDKLHLESGEKAVVQIRRTGEGASKGLVHVEVSPLNTQFDIRVEAR